jgi:hypothetical protein
MHGRAEFFALPYDMNSQPLLTPVRMGKLELRNRIIMAPATKQRTVI